MSHFVALICSHFKTVRVTHSQLPESNKEWAHFNILHRCVVQSLWDLNHLSLSVKPVAIWHLTSTLHTHFTLRTVLLQHNHVWNCLRTVCVCSGMSMHYSSHVLGRGLKVRMGVCSESWGGRWDRWNWQDITGPVGWASSGINKCKCWLSAHRGSQQCTAGPDLTTCPGTQRSLPSPETCIRKSCLLNFNLHCSFLHLFLPFSFSFTCLSWRQSWSHPDLSSTRAPSRLERM